MGRLCCPPALTCQKELSNCVVLYLVNASLSKIETKQKLLQQMCATRSQSFANTLSPNLFLLLLMKSQRHDDKLKSPDFSRQNRQILRSSFFPFPSVERRKFFTSENHMLMQLFLQLCYVPCNPTAITQFHSSVDG